MHTLQLEVRMVAAESRHGQAYANKRCQLLVVCCGGLPVMTVMLASPAMFPTHVQEMFKQGEERELVVHTLLNAVRPVLPTLPIDTVSKCAEQAALLGADFYDAGACVCE